MPIVCYADESGTHDSSGASQGAEAALIAGYVAWQSQWDTFTRLWQDTLATYGVPVFHYVEFAHQAYYSKDSSPYFGWSDAKREEFLLRLAAIARDNTVLGVAGVVDVKAYNRLYPVPMKRHPWTFAQLAFFEGIKVNALSRFGSPFPSDERIAFVFDRQDEFRKDAVMGHAAACLDARGRDTFGSFEFADKSDRIPLQAADLLAARVRRSFTRVFINGAPLPPGSWDSALGKRANIFLRYYDEEYLQQMADSVANGTAPQVVLDYLHSTKE